MTTASETNDFGVKGAREHSIALDTQDQAEKFHRRLHNALLRAQTQAEPVQAGQLEVVIVGAGATGVELSAELCISRMMERKSWPGKTPWNWEERYHALCVIADNTKNMKPWTAWDYVPDGLLVWEAWLEWRNNNLEAYARLIGDRS